MLAIRQDHASIEEAMDYDLVRISLQIQAKLGESFNFRISAFEESDDKPVFVLEVRKPQSWGSVYLGEVRVRTRNDQLSVEVCAKAEDSKLPMVFPLVPIQQADLTPDKLRRMMNAAVLLVLVYS